MNDQLDAPRVTEDNQPSHVVSGKKVILVTLGSVIVAFIFFGWLINNYVKPVMADRHNVTNRYFDQVEAMLKAYHADNGAFPREDRLVYYWMSGSLDRRAKAEKNAKASGAINLSTYHYPAMTTPINYYPADMSELAGDPYASPMFHAPPAYVNNGDYAVIWSSAGDIFYDINNTELKGLSREEVTPILEAKTFDPKNGIVSDGDLWRIVVP